ncbi:MAG: hypothetical protein ABIG84_02760 [archaeon]
METNISGMFNDLTDAGYPDVKIMFLIFLVFIIVAYKVFNVLKNAIIIAVISASFPFILNRFFGYAMDITVDLILFYASAGVVLYVLYEVFKLFYNSSKLFLGAVSILLYPFVLLSKFLYWLLGFGGRKEVKDKKPDDADNAKKVVKKHRHHKKR